MPRLHDARVAGAVALFLDEPQAVHIELSPKNPLLFALAQASSASGHGAYAPSFDAAWAAVEGMCGAEDRLERLLAEHCRLFIGPSTPLANPCEHAYLDRADAFAAAVESRRTLARLGLGVRSGARTSADHISVVLEVFARLHEARRHAEAERYHADHLAGLASGLAAAITKATTCSLHAAVASTLAVLARRGSAAPQSTLAQTGSSRRQETRS